MQERLGSNLGATVAAAESPTSLELSLEEGKVRESSAAYVDELSRAMENMGDAVGVLFAINGAMYNADVYASPQLFRKLRPKLLESSAIEAVAQGPGKEITSLPTLKTVRTMLITIEGTEASKRQVSPRIQIVTRESDDWLMTEAVDGDAWIHRASTKK
jgi:hypothetical protein